MKVLFWSSVMPICTGCGSLIYSEGFRASPTRMILRRVTSCVMAGAVLLMCLPLFPLIASAVKLSSPGPIFFRQECVGWRGEVFTLLKFRAVRQDAEKNSGAVWPQKKIPRVTSIGRWLRLARLDEIPQLRNVLSGNMAFISPRPERPEFVQWLADKIPHYYLRHIVPPGITGWAQVRYRYASSLQDSKEKFQYDLYYIKHMSLSLDPLIAFEPVKTVIVRRRSQ